MPAHRGSAHHKAVLTELKVRDMRMLHRAGVPVRRLAREYGVGIHAARKAISGESWAHVSDDPLHEPLQ